MVAIMRYPSSSSLQDLHSTVFMLLYTHSHARIGSGWTCANTSRCRMQWRVTREARRRIHERKKCRHAHLADASSLWSIFASTGGSTNVVVEETVGALKSFPLGRSCVNPLREAHTKLVPLSFSLSLLSPYSSFPSKGCQDRPYEPLAARSVSPIRVFLKSIAIRRFYALVIDTDI